MPKLYLICGHGDGDPGSSGNGYKEATQVRKLAAKIKELGGDNVIVHPTDRNPYAENDLRDYKFPADVQIVELHMDHTGNATAKGAHVIIDGSLTADKYDKALAEFVSGMFPGRANYIVRRDDLRNVNQAANRGLSYRLVENGFISNKGDADRFENEMEKLARGYLDAFGIGANPDCGWVKSDKGWWYRFSDGSWPASEWLKDDGKWYWFDSNGYMVSSCVLQIKGKWYAFGKSGAMLTQVEVEKSGALVLP
jgi:hypothetical protein